MSNNKDYDYFEYFCISAGFACEAAEYLHKTLQNFNRATFEGCMDEMHAIEHKADDAKHKMIRQLAHEFITPIEREDIVNLAHVLDDIVDDIDDIMRRIYMFNVTEIIPDAIEFSDLLVRCTAEMRLAMEDFRNFKKSKTLSDKLVALNTLESEGDTLHANCIKKLFSDCNDAVKKLIWTNIYEDMEDCADDCEGAAGIIESVIMKNL